MDPELIRSAFSRFSARELLGPDGATGGGSGGGGESGGSGGASGGNAGSGESGAAGGNAGDSGSSGGGSASGQQGGGAQTFSQEQVNSLVADERRNTETRLRNEAAAAKEQSENEAKGNYEAAKTALVTERDEQKSRADTLETEVTALRALAQTQLDDLTKDIPDELKALLPSDTEPISKRLDAARNAKAAADKLKAGSGTGGSTGNTNQQNNGNGSGGNSGSTGENGTTGQNRGTGNDPKPGSRSGKTVQLPPIGLFGRGG